jgi:hypothetical protein
MAPVGDPQQTHLSQTTACTRMEGVHLIEGAGHWVQQEQPERVNTVLLDFLRPPRASRGQRRQLIRPGHYRRTVRRTL